MSIKARIKSLTQTVLFTLDPARERRTRYLEAHKEVTLLALDGWEVAKDPDAFEFVLHGEWWTLAVKPSPANGGLRIAAWLKLSAAGGYSVFTRAHYDRQDQVGGEFLTPEAAITHYELTK